VGIASLAWNVMRAACWDSPSRLRSTLLPALAAGTASVLVMIAGNLAAALELLVARGVLRPEFGQLLGVKNFADGVVVGTWPPAGTWWWRASRVVPNIKPDGINEFPFFSAFLSDLHPHFLALPFEALVLGVAACHVLSRGRTLHSPWTQGMGAISLGSLLALNTWDVAPFWVLYAGLS
jgi:uncharacterized membrane protein